MWTKHGPIAYWRRAGGGYDAPPNDTHFPGTPPPGLRDDERRYNTAAGEPLISSGRRSGGIFSGEREMKQASRIESELAVRW